jgi:preprotein translocase YajC subunit
MTLILTILLLFAQQDGGDQGQGQPQGQGQGQQPGMGNMMYVLPAMVVFMIFMMWRNSRRQSNEQQTMLNTLEKNDKVLTHAMIYGTVVSVKPNEDEVTIRVDDNNNTRLTMTKAAIARNITKEQARAAAAATAAANKAGAATPPPAPVPTPQTGVTEKPTT